MVVVSFSRSRFSGVTFVEVTCRRNLYRHIVARDHFLRWNRQCHNTQIDPNHARNEWRHQEYTRPLGPGETTEHENHTTLILLHYPDRGEDQQQHDNYNDKDYNKHNWIHGTPPL